MTAMHDAIESPSVCDRRSQEQEFAPRPCPDRQDAVMGLSREAGLNVKARLWRRGEV
jgi:hypothetical protein